MIPTPEETHSPLSPPLSLISKSEKALQRLRPGTWQHRSLEESLAALRLAVALIDPPPGTPSQFAPEALQSAIGSIRSQLEKTQAALPKFKPGTAQHSLLTNRLRALRHVEATIKTRQLDP